MLAAFNAELMPYLLSCQCVTVTTTEITMRTLLPPCRAGLLAATICLCVAPSAQAGDGPLGIDHRIGFDNDGIWGRSQQHIMIGTLVAGEILLGVWEGGDSRLGRTDWQAIDASLIATVSAEAMKRVFRRRRPNETDNPNEWFRSGHDRSFPSGEVATISALVTPFVLEYGQDHPWAWALELLPAYDAYARMKTHGHWQTDVLAGFALGTAAGYYSHGRKTSFTLNLMPHGVQVGIRGRW
jgi:undecaprenyl-diphosphatase